MDKRQRPKWVFEKSWVARWSVLCICRTPWKSLVFWMTVVYALSVIFSILVLCTGCNGLLCAAELFFLLTQAVWTVTVAVVILRELRSLDTRQRTEHADGEQRHDAFHL